LSTVRELQFEPILGNRTFGASLFDVAPRQGTSDAIVSTRTRIGPSPSFGRSVCERAMTGADANRDRFGRVALIDTVVHAGER